MVEAANFRGVYVCILKYLSTRSSVMLIAWGAELACSYSVAVLLTSPSESLLAPTYICPSVLSCSHTRLEHNLHADARRYMLLRPFSYCHDGWKGTTFWRMSSSGMLHRAALVRTDVSEELSASIIRVTRIGELGTLAINSFSHLVFLPSICRLLVMANIPSSPILITLMMEALSSSETSVLTRATTA
jgi:hypothetical protein